MWNSEWLCFDTSCLSLCLYTRKNNNSATYGPGKIIEFDPSSIIISPWPTRSWDNVELTIFILADVQREEGEIVYFRTLQPAIELSELLEKEVESSCDSVG